MRPSISQMLCFKTKCYLTSPFAKIRNGGSQAILGVSYLTSRVYIRPTFRFVASHPVASSELLRIPYLAWVQHSQTQIYSGCVPCCVIHQNSIQTLILKQRCNYPNTDLFCYSEEAQFNH